MSCMFCEMELHRFCESPKFNDDLGLCCCPPESTITLNLATEKRPVGRPKLERVIPEAPKDSGIEEILPVAEEIKSATHDNESTMPGQQSMRGKWKKLGAPMKAPTDMKNIMATGRARAKIVKPITEGVTICEWTKLRFAGGGVLPIIGCGGNLAESVHHGPNKSVMFNEVSNLHRVCQVCHERWHICNDVYYGDVRPPDGGAWLPGADFQIHDHQGNIIVSDDAMTFSDAMWKKIRDASRHSRHDEADMYRETLMGFMQEGLELIP